MGMIPLLVILGALSLLLAIGLVAVAVLLHRTRRRLQELEAEARHDPLTGLPNRRSLKLHWEHMAGDKALLLIDLVGFKAVNDSHGHVVGDALLLQVSARLLAAVAKPGLLARWGGDEFVAIVPAARLDSQKALIADARTLPYDLSAAGGPDAVLVGARVGISPPQADLEAAIRKAACNLLEMKANESEDRHKSVSAAC